MSAAAAQEAAARAQIEYYFSYANYSRDEYLRSLADADGYVALDAPGLQAAQLATGGVSMPPSAEAGSSC